MICQPQQQLLRPCQMFSYLISEDRTIILIPIALVQQFIYNIPPGAKLIKIQLVRTISSHEGESFIEGLLFSLRGIAGYW